MVQVVMLVVAVRVLVVMVVLSVAAGVVVGGVVVAGGRSVDRVEVRQDTWHSGDVVVWRGSVTRKATHCF